MSNTRFDLHVEVVHAGKPVGHLAGSLPAPSEAIVLDTKGVAGAGLSGRIRLKFSAPVRGPVLLGRNRYAGGGLFLATRSNSAELVAADGAARRR